jgi:hypothetical protein
MCPESGEMRKTQKTTGLSARRVGGPEKKGGPIFCDVCHYVIENKYRKNVRAFVCHYVDDNMEVSDSCHYVVENAAS